MSMSEMQNHLDQVNLDIAGAKRIVSVHIQDIYKPG